MALSVVMPVYNLQACIDRTIWCLWAQDFGNFEVIMVDDGSTDTTVAKILALTRDDKRFKLLKQKNKGAAAARNYGLSKACGRTVLFLDGDDVFLPNFFSSIYRKYVLTRAQVTIFGWRGYNLETHRFNDVGKFAFCNKLWARLPQKLADNLFQLTINSPWSQLYERQFLLDHQLQFDTSVKTCNDVYFVMMSYVLASKIAFVDAVLLYYLHNRFGSISFRFDQTTVNDGLISFMKVREQLIKLDLYQVYERSFINAFFKVMRWRFVKCQGKARRRLYQSLVETVVENDLDHFDEHYFYERYVFDFYRNICEQNVAIVDEWTAVPNS